MEEPGWLRSENPHRGGGVSDHIESVSVEQHGSGRSLQIHPQHESEPLVILEFRGCQRMELVLKDVKLMWKSLKAV